MTVAAQAAKASTERFTLVRLEPARHVSTELVSQGSGVYTLVYDRPIERVTRNGNALTEVSTVTNNDEWHYDEATTTLTVKLASAPSSSTNVIVIFFYVFLT